MIKRKLHHGRLEILNSYSLVKNFSKREDPGNEV